MVYAQSDGTKGTHTERELSAERGEKNPVVSYCR